MSVKLHSRRSDTIVGAVREITVDSGNWLALALVSDDPRLIAPERIRLYFENHRVDFWLAS